MAQLIFGNEILTCEPSIYQEVKNGRCSCCNRKLKIQSTIASFIFNEIQGLQGHKSLVCSNKRCKKLYFIDEDNCIKGTNDLES